MHKKSKDVLQLEEPGAWDFDHAEKRVGLKKQQVIVLVAFRQADFERIAKQAERLGESISEFIYKMVLKVV